MNKRIEISVNQEDVQNIIDCYEKDIEYIKQLEAKVNQLESTLNEVRAIVSKSVFKTDLVELCRMKNQIRDVLDSFGGSNE